MKLILKRQPNYQWLATIDGCKCLPGEGPTRNAAMGALMRNNLEIFNVNEIEDIDPFSENVTVTWRNEKCAI